MSSRHERDLTSAESAALAMRYGLDAHSVAEAEALLAQAEDEPVSQEWIAATVMSATAMAPGAAIVPARRRVPLVAAALAGLLLCMAAVTVVQLWSGTYSMRTLDYPSAMALLQTPPASDQQRDAERASALGVTLVDVSLGIDALKSVCHDASAGSDLKAAAVTALATLKKQVLEGLAGSVPTAEESVRAIAARLVNPVLDDGQRMLALVRLATLTQSGIIALQSCTGSERFEQQRISCLRRLARTVDM